MDEIVFKTRILVFGANGSLGRRLAEIYSTRKDVELLLSSGTDRGYFTEQDFIAADITSPEDVKKIVFNFLPDVIINAAAFTNVDRCESERETAWKVNVRAIEHIADAARVYDSYIIHISSDYVFDGHRGPYYENDKTNPLGYYGRTKLASENALRISGTNHTILRTNVLYGLFPGGKLDFVRWVVQSINNREQIRIVSDQINNPTFVDDLADAIGRVIKYRKQGVYHIGGMEFLSRYDFTMMIAEVFDLDTSYITQIVTSELKQAAKRPLRAGLYTIKAQSELGYRPHALLDTLLIMKKTVEA